VPPHATKKNDTCVPLFPFFVRFTPGVAGPLNVQHVRGRTVRGVESHTRYFKPTLEIIRTGIISPFEKGQAVQPTRCI